MRRRKMQEKGSKPGGKRSEGTCNPPLNILPGRAFYSHSRPCPAALPISVINLLPGEGHLPSDAGFSKP